MRFYDFMIRCVGVPLFGHILHARLTNAQAIPREGPVILAANHLGGMDVLVVAALIERPIVYPAKAELFQGRGVKRLLGWWLRKMGQVPIDRSGGRASADGLRPLVEVLAAGGVVGIFPEGTRSPDGRLYRGHTGVGRLALATGAPVIPLGMNRTHARPGFLGFPTMRDAQIEFGSPIEFPAPSGQQADAAAVRRATDQIMAGIQQITGQSYVDVYASRVKSGALDAATVETFVRSRPGEPEPCPPASVDTDPVSGTAV
ncbi:MAG: 1-acyl-sn-glycerol-3-phosphate acyltransferase [Propionibacteriaceae bacterium]|nr:1-acyl-sn-glycerol-3-phosphate acyltransferase [Propionibacteriaceae bacterium]